MCSVLQSIDHTNMTGVLLTVAPQDDIRLLLPVASHTLIGMASR